LFKPRVTSRDSYKNVILYHIDITYISIINESSKYSNKIYMLRYIIYTLIHYK